MARDPRVPETLEAGWVRHLEALRRRRAGPPDEHEQRYLRDAYYVGASACFDMIMHGPGMDDPIGNEEQCLANVSRLNAEIDAFGEELKARVVLDLADVKGRAH